MTQLVTFYLTIRQQEQRENNNKEKNQEKRKQTGRKSVVENEINEKKK